jgi:hypothetical protein
MGFSARHNWAEKSEVCKIGSGTSRQHASITSSLPQVRHIFYSRFGFVRIISRPVSIMSRFRPDLCKSSDLS